MRDEFGSISLKFPFDARSDSDGFVTKILEEVVLLFGLLEFSFVSLSRASDWDVGLSGALERIGIFVDTHVVSFHCTKFIGLYV